MRIFPASLRACFVITVLAVPFFLPAVAAAQESSTLWPRFALEAGAFLATTDVEARVDDGDVPGTTIRFEDDLGADPEATVASARLELLAGRRHGFSLSYYEVDQAAARSIDRSITIGDFTYPIGAEAEGEFRAAQLELAYTLWVVREERGGLGLTLGVVGMDAEARAAARVRIGDFVREESVEGETTAPLPGVGLEGRPSWGIGSYSRAASATCRRSPWRTTPARSSPPAWGSNGGWPGASGWPSPTSTSTWTSISTIRIGGASWTSPPPARGWWEGWSSRRACNSGGY